MKHLSFVWANLWRKPIRTMLTFVSVAAGFALLGLVLGFSGTLRHIVESANPERVYTSPRFGGRLFLGQMQQLSRMRYVSHVGALGAIVGYYQLPRNRVVVLMQGPGMRKLFERLGWTAGSISNCIRPQLKMGI